jgi:putative hydroxymethylpyrimidine transport system substrate-binding protein
MIAPRQAKERSSFLKKRSKKLLWAVADASPECVKKQKFFGSFFQKRTASFLLLIALLVPATARAADRLTVMLDWLPNPDEAPLFIAAHEGFFARNNLEVRLIAPSDASTPPMMAATGHADIAITYQPQLYLLAAHGVPLIRFATLIDTPLDSIIALKGGPIKTLADLKGHTLGYAVPGVEEVLAQAMIASAGVTPSDVKLVNVNFQIVSVVLTRRVDATISAYRNKEIYELRAHGADALSFFPEEHGVPAYDELIFVTRRGLAADPRLGRFVAALQESTAWLLDHPEEGFADFAADYPAQASPLVHTQWNATLCRFDKSPGLLDTARYRIFGNFLAAKKLIPSAPAVADIAVQTEAAQSGAPP